MNNLPKFRVTKMFTSGALQGITITQVTTVQFAVGRAYSPCAGSSGYIVTACVEV